MGGGLGRGAPPVYEDPDSGRGNGAELVSPSRFRVSGRDDLKTRGPVMILEGDFA